MSFASIQDVAAIVGPCAAAIAAIASLFALRQTREIARSAQLPDLSIQPLIRTGTRQLGASIHNAGGGVARGVMVVIADGEYLVTIPVGIAMIRPNERFEIWTDIQRGAYSGGDQAEGMYVRCRDRFGVAHGWTHKEVHDEKPVRRGRKHEPEMLLDGFRAAFPEIDTEGRRDCNVHVSGPA
jgi:hypothetical protein